MPRQKSAVLKGGKTTRAVQRATKLKELKAELKEAIKEADRWLKLESKLAEKIAALQDKIDAASAPKQEEVVISPAPAEQSEQVIDTAGDTVTAGTEEPQQLAA